MIYFHRIMGYFQTSPYNKESLQKQRPFFAGKILTKIQYSWMKKVIIGCFCGFFLYFFT